MPSRAPERRFTYRLRYLSQTRQQCQIEKVWSHATATDILRVALRITRYQTTCETASPSLPPTDELTIRTDGHTIAADRPLSDSSCPLRCGTRPPSLWDRTIFHRASAIQGDAAPGTGDARMVARIAPTMSQPTSWIGDNLARIIHDGLSRNCGVATRSIMSVTLADAAEPVRRPCLARGAVRKGAILEQDVDRPSGEPACREACAAANPRLQQKRS